MNSKNLKRAFARLALFAAGPFILFIVLTYSETGAVNVVAEEESTTPRRINAPYFADGVKFSQTAIFWFGRIDTQNNYVDVRVGFDNNKLWIRTAAADRRLWYNQDLNKNPNAADLTNWDAISIFLDTDNNGGSSPTAGDYRFVSQLNWWEERDNYNAAYKGSGGSWVQIPFTITADSGWRGNQPVDNVNDRGWTMTYEIPFSKLGLSGPPSQGTVWGLGVVLHDRDSAAGPPLANKTWPEQMNGSQPATWGNLAFGLPSYKPPAAVQGGVVTIRHKLNGVTVKDAHVGGGTTCGAAYGPDFFNGWGDANYAGVKQINVQGLGDISDWPCFSKIYLTFPLGNVPSGQAILSAKLTLHQFGGSDPSQAEPSLIQVSTLNEAWNEGTITWNNAPLAAQNVARTWASPIKDFPGWPGVPVSWDVSGAMADAYEQVSELRLVLYEADWAYHSGKYFLSSEEDDWNAVARPTLEVEWGSPGFDMNINPQSQAISSSNTTSYAITIQHGQSLNQNVILEATSPSSMLDVSISPTNIAPPGGTATLTIKSKHAPSSTDAAIFTIPIKASAGTIVQQSSVSLVLNGKHSYLPLVRD
ncbi:MAG: DNRLRE domain-containing protein [Candidatus Promineifilaceae bacterium]|jgi:hypothetical protein